MTAQIIARCLVGSFLLAVYFALEDQKKLKKTEAGVIKPFVAAIAVTIILGYVTRPISYFIDEFTNVIAKQVQQTMDQVSLVLDERSAQSSGNNIQIGSGSDEEGNNIQPVEEDNDHQDGEERNNIIYDKDIPLADRVLVPDGSLYPDIDMQSVPFLESRGVQSPGYQGGERSSDSVTYAFTAPMDDPAGLYEELKIEILKNPVVGDMIVQGLADVYPNFETIPSMKEFLDACNDAFDRSDEPRGMDVWLSAYRFPDEQVGIYVTNSYRLYAEKICQILDGFTNYGVKELASTKTYTNASFAIYMRTSVHEFSYKTPALVLYKADDEGNVICAMGFDLNDKGLLIYSPSVI